MSDTDRLLINTSWTRAKGTHGPLVATIDRINERGPRLKSTTGERLIISWAELDFSWKPTDRRTEKAYDTWKLAAWLETHPEKEESKVSNGTLTIEHPETSVKECHGPWHRHGDKKDGNVRYDLLPLSEFSIVERGSNKGHLAATCDKCRQKHRLSDSKKKLVISKVEPPTQKLEAPAPVKIEPGVVTETGITYRWQVTVVQPTVHIVQAKDFLDAAAQVASLGEVVKVEKL